MYELIEIAVREFEASAKQATDEERFITKSAAKFDLNVHFSRVPNLVREIVLLHIVNVHEALERFLKSLRGEAATLVGLQWTDYDKKDSLYVAIQNVFGDQRKGRTALSDMKIELCGYYRLIRNAAIHPDRDPATLTKRFADVKHCRDEAIRYATIAAAPNPPDSLTRDDFQLFVRIAQDVAWEFSQELRPTKEQLCTAVKDMTESFKNRWPNKRQRVHTAIVNYLFKTYGIPKGQAGIIANQVH